MNLTSFLKDKFIFILLQVAIIFFLGLLLSILDISVSAIVLICLCILIVTAFALIWEYTKKSLYYKSIYSSLEKLDKKQYISSFLQEPDFMEAEILCDILKQATKSMNDEVAAHRHLTEEYQDYIETWIHEIKLPISCIDLICENNKGELASGILKELSRIDHYVEQALYYARSTNVEKDYSVRQVSLDILVKSSVKKHSKELIAAKTELSLKGLEKTVYCDPKWLDFVLGQTISNSIKYKKDTLSLSFSSEEKDDCIVLSIIDNGIGISEKDISRVFEKGFTGQNGRSFSKSTGIGLYLCKRLCDKMHLGFNISSVFGQGTTIIITFPKDSRILLEN